MSNATARNISIRHHRLYFYGFWLLLGLMQAALTELQDDEAYYWLYGKFLDWGYFDHPPMIGLLVKSGYAFFQNELGVRFFPLLLNVLSLLIIEKLIDKKDPFLFYTIALSIAVLQLSGFVAVPDIPLIFFTALFFLFFKRFIGSPNIQNVVLLGLSMALLFYSKYHAVLIVLFAIASRPRLFLQPRFYLSGIIALLLFLPHLWWQYQHDWVSFRYHLFESNVNAYKFSFTTEYIIGQLLLPGPIAGIILLPAALLYKPATAIERAMKFTMLGIYIFFLLSSFRGRVEANWTSPALVPLMVLSHQYLVQNFRWRNWLTRLLPITLLLVLFARIIMIMDILPVKEIRKRYHSWKEWPAEMKARTSGLPVVFSNSYQRASKYWFYTGQPTYSQNHYQERRNNFNFWPVEDSLLGKQVYFLDIYRLYRFPDSLQTAIGHVGYQYDSTFHSFAKVQFILNETSFRLTKNDSLRLTGKVSMPAHYMSYVLSNPVYDTIRVGVFSQKGWLKDLETPLKLQQLAVDSTFNFTAGPLLPEGNYYFRFTIHTGIYNGTHNSDKIKLEIK